MKIPSDYALGCEMAGAVNSESVEPKGCTFELRSATEVTECKH